MNPRPKWSHPDIYMLVPSSNLAPGKDGGQTRPGASGHVGTGFAVRSPSGGRVLLLSRSSAQQASAGARVAIIKPREPCRWQLTFFPDFLRGQPGFLGMQPGLQPPRRNQDAPVKECFWMKSVGIFAFLDEACNGNVQADADKRRVYVLHFRASSTISRKDFTK